MTPMYDSVKGVLDFCIPGDEIELGVPAGFFEVMLDEVEQWAKTPNFRTISLKDGYFVLKVGKVKLYVWRRPS